MSKSGFEVQRISCPVSTGSPRFITSFHSWRNCHKTKKCKMNLLLLPYFFSLFFQVIIEKLLSMAIQQLSYIFSCNFIQSCLLWRPAEVFNSVVHYSELVKSCIKCGRNLCHTPFKHFHDSFSQAALKLLVHLNMLNWAPIMLDNYFWPVQNSYHFHEDLAEVRGFKVYHYPLVDYLRKWRGVWWHVNNIAIQRCSDFRKVCRMARGTVQEKNSLGW